MTRPSTATEGEALVHCSTDRILLVSTGPDGTSEMLKILERGSLADAEREVATGRRLAGLGVATYLAAEPDPQTGRPCVRMVLHEGRDLETLVAEEGALPPVRAARILAEVAHTLAGMHAIEAPDAPVGIAHGDVKPGNVLVGPGGTLLLDLENAKARPGGTPREPAGGFTGGTHAFAPPEAHAGLPVDAPFDVYGLGVTLHFALTGTLPRTGTGRSLIGHAASLRELVEACTSVRPEARPTAARVARVLESAAAELEHDPAEAVLAELQRGELAAARAALERATQDDQRRQELARLLEHRQRLLRRVDPPRADAGEERDPKRLASLLRKVQTFTSRFPRHAASLELRKRVRAAAIHLLLETPVRIAELNRRARYPEARGLLQGCIELVDLLLDQPGRFQVPADGSPRMPGVLQRSPRRFLERTLREIDSNEAAHREVMQELSTAERDLDLPAAEAVVESLSEIFGGASPITAHYKDRLHRLGFYVERLAGSRPRLDHFADVLRLSSCQVDLGPLYALVDRCRERVERERPDVASGPGMRGLQLTLRDLAEEFPGLEAEARSALDCLHAALVAATGIAWRLLAEAGEKLASEPVPVRPLQSILHRLDSLRLVESYLDLPDKPRSSLLDRIEAVRMKIEQARATRDRIARGAEQAMARGHWTTGLFDMERAIGHLAGEDDDEDEAPESKRLLERLHDAKRRKREIEHATRRNVELASRYATLQDEANSSVEERLALLTERRECLTFLAHHMPAERAELYARDLREVDVLVAQEHAAQAEMSWDATEDPQERLSIAERVLTTLAARLDEGAEAVGRVQRLIEHWRRQKEQADREVRRLAEEEAEGRRRASVRRRLVLVVSAAAVILATLLGLETFAGQGDNATMAAELHRRLGPEPVPAAIAGDPERAIHVLREAVESLNGDAPHPAASAAGALAAALRGPAGPPDQLDLAYWSRHFTEQLNGYVGSVRAWDVEGRGAEEVRSALQSLGVRLWRTGVVLAVLAARDPAAVDEWQREGDRLAVQLQAPWLRLPEAFAADLHGLMR